MWSTGTRTPGPSLQRRLKESVQAYGIYNQNLRAVPPTGSISYINHSTSLYYIRLRQMALEGTEVEGCVSCML
jgi:Ribonucleotide reductase, barrel domain